MRLLSVLSLLLSAIFVQAAETVVIDFTREIRPILNNSCFACHGPDEAQRKAKLRLDVRDEAVRKAIIPGKGIDSPVYKRIISKEADEVMPPAHAKKPAITAAQAELVRKWIDAGAKFDEHWAFVKPVRVEQPMVKNQSWVKNPIDAFVAREHEKQGFSAAPPADKHTLLRRLSFDLTGLPPTPAMVDAYLKNASADADALLIEELLKSPHFGERMAVMWLDAIRYADTAGYHSDNHRDVWMFRDYVIRSFNENKPFDVFTQEQLAGDLVPKPTNEQRVASGYNRLLMTTEEGGAQAKEYTAKYVADRVRNSSNAWLGVTLGCAECHNHKYDPFTQKDFYRFGAFFADVAETAVGRQQQTPIVTPEQDAEIKKFDAEIAKAKTELAAAKIDEAAITKWEPEAKKNPKGLPKPVTDALNVEADKRTDAHKKTLQDHYRNVAAPETEAIRKTITETTAKKEQFVKSLPQTLISTSSSPRMVRVLPRGNWQDDSGEVVTPNVPGFLPPTERAAKLAEKERLSRADLAKWLVAPENPLTARVFVNRLWKIAFGQGLVRNMDDFGTQGTPPSHPELLDWLATEFIRSKWDVKGLLKLMVSSNAYRQSSVSSKALRDKDPGNMWLARQNRFRLDAEFVRDNTLAVSGLINRKIGGPSVKPYQPAGYWSYLNFPTREWQNDRNADQYRRGLYTYWCRSFPHPSLSAFDAPSREECTNERTRSSTPLQALVLLNDPTYVEGAKLFAERIIENGGKTTAERLNFAYRQALTRPAKAEEVKVLEEILAKHLAEYRGDLEGAKKLLGAGFSPMPAKGDIAELAAWTSVSRVILNLHEAVTRN
ncbi:PSD1 and planctomycete cytochrome C domain-containing protein [Zavarzinella formosa]|uniref:PSD1 and planctomycete cytochrome C domain-containing protein n=1 Tax=Zavarzinella formosa TaxID=360055 RepID=UPI00037DEC6A|nr:PSD1 and planctomycete cytochrome C domain-containing protein [Zavarzinella formosa]